MRKLEGIAVRLIRWSAAPSDVTSQQRKNFTNVQIDAIGIGLANAASPFLPVFLTRLGASNFQVGLLSSMPAVTGLFFALLVGRFLQTRRKIVPWFSAARLLVVSSYAATGLAAFVVPREQLIPTILAIWALATLPQTVVAVAFSVVMNAVAGPHHRYDLMSRRWSVLGLTSALTVALVGQVLDRIDFPLNYQVVFLGLSVGGLISYYFSSHIVLPESHVPAMPGGLSIRERLRNYSRLVLGERDFVRFSIQRFVFLTGISLAVPLFPIYYVREVQASNTWIGFISTMQTAVLLFGYYFWTRATRLRGSRFVLLAATAGMAFYPALVASTHQVELIVIYAGLAGVFQAGVDLVFFDELMKTVPPEYSATFVSLAQSLQHFSAVLSPLAGTALASWIGIGWALVISTVVRLMGFGLFAFWSAKKEDAAPISGQQSELAAEEELVKD
jgi:MFS family permease